MRKLVLFALLLFACHRDEWRGRVNVILISIDTLRSDHLPLYGYHAIKTPNLDGLAKDGVVFEHAFANVPLTLPSHATIMTGLLPAEHGVRDNAGFTLDSSKPTIASLLRANGYATGAAVSAYVLRRDTNLASGFDFYDDRIAFIEDAPTGNLQRGGTETASIITKWMESQSSRPFFAFVHLFEPHTPYEPTYDAEVVRSDRIVGQLLDSLRARGLYDDALILVLSDHGEGLGDHGEAEHGVLLYREALQVPLIVKLPRGERRGERVTEAVQLADIFPTVADVVRIAPPTVRGESLLGKIGPRPLHAETLYPRIHLGWSDLRSIVRYPLHLIHGPKPELYDLAADPREEKDVREAKRRDAARLARDLGSFPYELAAVPRVDAEEQKKLAALGYVNAGASSKPSNLNPRDHLHDLAALKEVTELMSRHDYANAVTRIEALLARNPGWSDLRDDLGIAYENLGDLARAEQTYREAIRNTPELAPDFALSLAYILAREGKVEEAKQHANVALTNDPPGAHDLLARIALARGDFDGAMQHAEAMRKFAAHESSADVLTAEILIAQRNYDDALAALKRVHDRATTSHTPLPRRAWFLTGDVLARLGRTKDARVAFERAIAREPHNRAAYVALAFTEASGGNRGAAEAVLRRMVSAIPESRAEAEKVRSELGH
ncbi:MAG TPA: sulfatase-like hydrolase/transferase [Thermoanaerobaculia bacterium]|nr:sulfatase-like hydrolase/transferase [Thermoanaerobaculia bacterium]